MLSFYYTLKPFIPRRLQLWMRRIWVRFKLRKCGSVWPIDERAGAPPEGWTGWPEGRRFAVVLMHDVDTEKGQQMSLELAKIDEEMGFRSSFNFVPEGYDVSPEVRRILMEKGFEVAVHGLKHDGKLFLSREKFLKQASRINRYLKEWGSVGFVSPSMHRNLEWMHHLDIEYDASTFDTDPFEPQPEGVSTIFPFFVPCSSSITSADSVPKPQSASVKGPIYFPFFPSSNSINPINPTNPMNSMNSMNSINSINSTNPNGFVELPYTLPQDFTLFVLMKEKDITIWKKKLDWIVKQGGMALFITHPDYMSFNGEKRAFYEYPSDHYKRFLKYIKETYEGEYWNPLPKEMARFWHQRGLERVKRKKTSPLKRYEVALIDPLADPRWDAFVENHPFGWICHLSGWKRVLESTFSHMKGHYLALVDSEGEIKAGLPLYEVRSPLTGNRLVSIPFATLSDPLVSDGDQLDELLEAAKAFSKKIGIPRVQVRTTNAHCFVNNPQFARNNGFKCHFVKLDMDLAALWRSLSRKGVRQEVSRARKNNLFLKHGESEEDIKLFYRLYTQTRRRLGLPTHPYLFLKTLWDTFKSGERMELCLALYEGRAIAGHVLFKFNNRVSAEFEGWNRKYRKLSPNHFLFWEEIKQAHKEGFRIYDFGRTSTQNVGLMEFKNRWGTEICDLPIFYYSPEGARGRTYGEGTVPYRLIRSLFRIMPETIHPLFGKWLYNHLG